MAKKKIQCLFNFDYEELIDIVENLLHIKNWFVRKVDIDTRTENISKTDRFLCLKTLAEEKNIDFDTREVVTWLDSLTTLYYVFDKIEDEHLRDSIKIIQEYCIPYTKKRADYLLIYNNKILIIEFSFNKLGYELQYETKLQQAIGYKELLSNILPKEIDIGTYTFLIEPEEDEHGNTLKIKNTDYFANHYKIEDLAKFIEKFFNKNINLAINSLKQI